MAFTYPLMLDVSRRRVVIVGGGPVAARKAVGVLSAGCLSVTVVSPAFGGTFDPAVVRREKRYESNDLIGADLVFAATDSAVVNDAVVRDANAAKIWVCRADDSETSTGDFVTPAKFQSGPVTVTVSAGSAALSVMIRDRLSARFDPVWADMAAAMETLRPAVRDQSGLDPVARRDLFRRLATDEAMAVLASGGTDGLKSWLSGPVKLKNTNDL